MQKALSPVRSLQAAHASEGQLPDHDAWGLRKPDVTIK